MNQTARLSRRVLRLSLLTRLLGKRAKPVVKLEADPLFMFADAPGVDLHPRGRL